MSNLELLYKTQATSVGGREAKVVFGDNPAELKLGLPKELGGAGADKAFNPEQLFAATYSSCFEGAIYFAAKNGGYNIRPTQVSAEISLLKKGGGFIISSIITVNFPHGTDKILADKLVEEADLVCPYSNAMRGNVKIDIRTVIG